MIERGSLRTRRRAVLTAAVLILLAPVAASCGDDDEPAAGADTVAPAGPTTTAAAPTTTAGGSAADAVAESFEVSTGDLYAPPDPLPSGEPGDLIFAEPFDTGDAAVAGWRVLYLSQSVPGEPVAVSGYVLAPNEPSGGQSRPIVSWAHGTTGSADRCAPSTQDDLYPTSDGGYGLAAQFREFLDRGYVVAATDYEGLGTPGPHPYLHGVSEGRGVLDIARAAGDLPEIGATGPVVVYGHSQGGHAALFAAELAPTYAPDLDVVGVAALAPASEFETLVASASAIPQFAGFYVAAVYGTAAADPSLDPAEVLDPGVVADAGYLEEHCISEVTSHYGALVSDLGIAPAPVDPLAVPGWGEALAANSPGQVELAMPALLLQGRADELGLAVTTPLLFERMCGNGSDVDVRYYDDVGHGGVLAAADGDVMPWIDARVAGDPATSACPA